MLVLNNPALMQSHVWAGVDGWRIGWNRRSVLRMAVAEEGGLWCCLGT